MSVRKVGLDYYPMDVDFFDDEKIEFVAAKFDELGELVSVKLLNRIYRSGYYLEWGEDQALLFAKRSGPNTSLDLVNGVVKELAKRKFLDAKQLKKHNILTSRGIQRRYIEATKRRKDVEIIKDFLLLSLPDVNKINQNVNIVAPNGDILPQSKVKESKVKESRKTRAPKDFPVTDQMKAYAEKKGYVADLQILTEKFITHHRAKGTKYVSWYAGWQKWLQNELSWHPERNVPPTDPDNPGAHAAPPIQPTTYSQAKDLEARQTALKIQQMQEKLNAGPDHTGAEQTQPLLQQ